MDRRKPNLLLITVDQFRADCLGRMGHPVVRTPHLDALGYEGVTYRNAYSNCPVCIPARTSIITGRDAHANGCPRYDDNYYLNYPHQNMLGSLVTAQGYQTQIIGKTHWNTPRTYRGGFESFLSTENTPSPLRRERTVKMGRSTLLHGMGANEFTPAQSFFPPELNSTTWMVDRALDFLDYRDRTVQFFLWLSLTEPHPPNAIHEPYYSMFDSFPIPKPIIPHWCADECCPYDEYLAKYSTDHGYSTSWDYLKKIRSVYYGTITHIDHQLGRLFGQLQLGGLWDNTMIVFTCDHGEKLGDVAGFSKSSFTECSANIPFIVKPTSDTICAHGRISDTLVELSDLLPTFCEVAGSKIPAGLSGYSLIPELLGQGGDRCYVHGQIGNVHMYRDDQYKYIYFANDGSELLFNMNFDRLDEYNLSGDTVLCAAMRRKLIAHLTVEGHEHLADGQLINYHKQKPTPLAVQEMGAKRLGLRWSAARECEANDLYQYKY